MFQKTHRIFTVASMFVVHVQDIHANCSLLHLIPPMKLMLYAQRKVFLILPQLFVSFMGDFRLVSDYHYYVKGTQ